MKKGSVLCALTLCVALVMAGCQPTPEKQAVVNKAQELPSGALVSQETGAPSKEYYEPVSYTVSGHWKEDIVKDDQFTVNADVDVMMPDADAFPVQKLKQIDLTQERLDALAGHFFEEGTSFHQMPMPRTKAEYEAEILRLKEDLAKVEAGGDGEMPESIRAYIKEVEQKYADAPEQNELVPADIKFTWRLDYETGKPVPEEGENYVYVGTKGENGVNRMLSASRAPSSVYFSYGEYSNMEIEQYMRQQEEYNAEDRERTMLAEEPYRSENLKEIVKQEERVEALKGLFAQNTIDLGEMQNKAIALLKDLGITNVQITSCEKAVFELDTAENSNGWTEEYTMPTRPGCYVEFKRENGGIPCVTQNGGHWGPELSMDGLYSAPFSPEQGYILMDEQGAVKGFSWSEAVQVTEQVSTDSKIKSFDEIKDRAVDHLYWYNMPHDEEGKSVYDMKLRFEVEEVKLIMTYINVKNEPEAVMAVPAWYVKAQGYATWFEEGNDSPMNGVESKYNRDEVIINALDGSPVLMPGMQQMIDLPQPTAPEG